MYIGPLKDARQNVKKHFTRGPKVADWLQVTYRSRQRLAKWQGDWRLVYLLLDASSPGLHPGCDLLAFGRAVFYVGKGLASRPFDHFKEAKAYLLSPYSAEVGASDLRVFLFFFCWLDVPKGIAPLKQGFKTRKGLSFNFNVETLFW